jgi:uncharacterized RDD family membrane protein YckC
MKTLMQLQKLGWLLGLGLALNLPLSLPAQDATEDKQPASDTPKIEAETNSEGVGLKLNAAPVRSHRGPTVAVGHDVTLKEGEVADEVVVVQGEATVDGEVEGDVVVVLGKAKINNKVHGELVSVLSNVELGPKAEIDGDAVAVGGTLRKAPGAKIHGQSPEIRLPSFIPDYGWLDRNIFRGVMLRPLPPALAWSWIVALIFFGIHLVILLLMPRPVQKCADTLTERPLRCLVVGILAYILFLPLLVFLSWTIIGVPVLICALVAAALVGKVVVYRVSGGQIGRQLGLSALDQPLIAFCLGTALFYLLYMVPIFGWVVWFLITPLGVGSVVCAALSGLQRERAKAPAQPPGPVYTPPPGVPPTGSMTVNPTSVLSVDPGTPTPMAAPAGGGTASLAVSAVPPLISSVTNQGLNSVEMASLPRVGFWPRLAAGALDVILVLIVSGLAIGGHAIFLFLLAAYLVGMWTWRGTTLGGAVLGLKVVRTDGRPLDFQAALVRVIGCFVSFAPCGLGFFWASWTPERQAWHDIIAGTVMVKLPKPVSLV